MAAIKAQVRSLASLARRPARRWKMHELIANITLALIVIHILAVVLASFAHHENLVRAMITGYKRS
jgi:cytochrome b